MEEKSLIKVGALWKNENKEGVQHLSGSFGGATLFVFKNKFKKTDKHPDYIVMMGERKKTESEEKAGPPSTFDKDLPF